MTALDVAPMSDVDASCPIAYRYSARDFRRAPSHAAETVYVIGGLYGNVEALHEILRMQAAEARRGSRVSLVFNGDHHWLNVDAASFREINDTVLAHVAIRGNVEAALSSPDDADCGCNYPDYVNAEYVARSNAIMARLRRTGRDFPALTAAIDALPMIRTIDVGGEAIGIVHGDAELLSGWGFAAERLSPGGKCVSGDQVTAALTPLDTIERYFRESGVRAFASSHTCLAHARDYSVDGDARLIINNGAAGLPNFLGQSFGLITRISANTTIPPESLYGITLGTLRFDALPVRFDQAAWLRRFHANWAPDSPAYVAYHDRIVSGPHFTPQDAIGGRVTLNIARGH